MFIYDWLHDVTISHRHIWSNPRDDSILSLSLMPDLTKFSEEMDEECDKIMAVGLATPKSPFSISSLTISGSTFQDTIPIFDLNASLDRWVDDLKSTGIPPGGTRLIDQGRKLRRRRISNVVRFLSP